MRHLIYVSNHTQNAGGASSYFAVPSTEDGIWSGESASASDDEIACADSISREIDEMNRFEEGDLEGKNANRYDVNDNN